MSIRKFVCLKKKREKKEKDWKEKELLTNEAGDNVNQFD